MTLERDAYVQTLARFTLLTENSPMTEMKAKNIDTIKTLIMVAHTDGNYLGSSWVDIIRCISQLELVQMIGTGVRPQFLSGPTQYHRDALDPSVKEHIGETSSQSIVVAVDRIFTGSIRLDGDAIVHFVRALCQVSLNELNGAQPRMFSLQKIVEISRYNMGRIRLQWSRIWQVLGGHFNTVGCNGNEEIVIFALDSLRQLSMSFIEKGEFANFRFQKEFLRPFEHIMENNNSPVIRDMVVRMVTQMVKSKALNIRSGWQNIFSVFYFAAGDQNEAIFKSAFQTTEKIIKEHFHIIIDSFQYAVKCLSEFACNARGEKENVKVKISRNAIDLLETCADCVHASPQLFTEHVGMENEACVSKEDRVWMRGWLPLLFSLTRVMNCYNDEVRTHGLNALFKIVKQHGDEFKPNWWKDLFNNLFRIFDITKLPEHIEKCNWMETICNLALNSIVDVFTLYFDVLGPLLLKDLYVRLRWCVQQNNTQLARSGIGCFDNLVLSNGMKFDDKMWDKTCKFIIKIYECTAPHELRKWKPPSNEANNNVDIFNTQSRTNQAIENGDLRHTRPTTPTTSTTPNQNIHGILKQRHSMSSVPGDDDKSDSQNSIFSPLHIKCVIQLDLIRAIGNVVFFTGTLRRKDAEILAVAMADARGNNAADRTECQHEEQGMYRQLKTRHLFKLIKCLINSHRFAKKFNSNHEQRNILWRAGLKGKEKPNMLIQETESLACVLSILMKMYRDEARTNDWPDIEQRMISVCHEAFDYFLKLQNGAHRDAWTSLLLLMLTGVNEMSDKRVSIIAFELIL